LNEISIKYGNKIYRHEMTATGDEGLFLISKCHNETKEIAPYFLYTMTSHKEAKS
jgi:hypothetical protein